MSPIVVVRVRDVALLGLMLLAATAAAAAGVATAIVEPQTLLDLPLLHIVATVGLATWGGFVRSLFALQIASDRGRPAPNLRLLFSLNLSAGSGMGLITAAYAGVQGLSPWYPLGAAFFTGFGGALLLAVLLNRFLRKLDPSFPVTRPQQEP